MQRPSLNEVWSEYGERLRHYLSARTSNPADVDDVLQEVLLRTHAHLGSVEDISQLRAWLFRVARNAMVDHQRQVGRRRETVIEPTQASVAPNAPMPDDSLELSACVRPFLQRLSNRDREVLETVDLEGRSQKDVAAELGVPYSTVKSRVKRARNRLAAELTSCCSVEIATDGTMQGVPIRSGSCTPES